MNFERDSVANRLLSSGVVLILAAGPACAELVRIGGAAAVRGSVNAVAPGSVGRVVESGKPIYLNDHVTTKTESRLQVLLLDESVFTLGPDSDMVMDEFVYDPATSAGKVTANLTKGVFRFVTGKVARQEPSNMTVKVPVGTIGIRGTKALVEVKPDVATVILEGPGKNNTASELPGSLHLETDKGSTDLTREGFGSDMRAGSPPTFPKDRSSDLERLNNILLPKPKANVAPPAQIGEKKTANAAQETGEDVIFALTGLQDTKTSGEESDQNSQITTQAKQDSVTTVADGLTTWDFIRSQLSTGLGTYMGSGSYTCTSGCTGNGTASFELQIDFGARTFGGNTGLGSSYVAVNAGVGGPSPQGLTAGASSSINAVSFSSLTGDAAYTLSFGNGSLTDSRFDGSRVSFINSGGVVADQAEIEIAYTNNSPAESVAGSVSGTRSSGGAQ